VSERPADNDMLNDTFDRVKPKRRIDDLVGGTPMVEISDWFDPPIGSLFLKLEKFNPVGSVKDRVARYIVDRAEGLGHLSPGGTLVESTSGNLGIALAMIGAQRGYRVIAVVDPRASAQNVAIMRAYGAEIYVEETKDNSGNYHLTKIATARRLAGDIPGAYWVNQTANDLNADTHYATTAPEILQQMGGEIDVCVVATSSGGQLAGINRFLKKHDPRISVLAVDIKGSQIFTSRGQAYLTPGLGLSWRPKLLRDDIDKVCIVDDSACFEAARFCARRGVLLGPSSGGLLVGMLAAAKRWDAKRIVGLCPDGGERYISTLLNDDWMRSNGFAVAPDACRIIEHGVRESLWAAETEAGANRAGAAE